MDYTTSSAIAEPVWDFAAQAALARPEAMVVPGPRVINRYDLDVDQLPDGWEVWRGKVVGPHELKFYLQAVPRCQCINCTKGKRELGYLPGSRCAIAMRQYHAQMADQALLAAADGEETDDWFDYLMQLP